MRLVYLPDCTRAHVSGRCSLDVYDAIDATLTYSEPGAFHSPQFKMGHWDGKVRLFNRKTQTFPVGLAPRVVGMLERRFGLGTEIVDERPPFPWGDEPPAVPRELGGGVTLFDDQVAALDAFVEAEAAGCLQLPTSAGKTEIAAALFKMLGSARGLMIEDRKALLAQTHERLELRLGERVGRIGDQRCETNRRVTVATIQSLWHHWDRFRVEFFPQIACVVADEAHRISKKMWLETLEIIPARVRLGLSATIKEASRRMVVESYMGPLIFEQELSELVEMGRAAMPRVAMLRIKQPDIDNSFDPTYAYWHGVVTSGYRNAMIVEAIKACIARELTVLILCVRIEHGRSIQALCTSAGLDVPFLWGQTDGDTIKREKANLEAGRRKALIASTIFDAGIDVPNVRAMVLAGGGRAALTTIQRVGRGVRKKKTGENEVRVLDFYDQTHSNLRSQADSRRKTYQRKKMEFTFINSIDEWLT